MKEDAGLLEKRSCCSSFCFYLWCCCCCNSNIKSNDFYRKNWKNYLYKEGIDDSDLPFNKQTKLFSNTDDEAIEALRDFRLYPNLISEDKLIFYIKYKHITHIFNLKRFFL